MIADSAWQTILGGFGQVLAFLYDIVRNYGVAIILLTLLVRLILLPLTIKQVRSMHAMQKIQPMVKELQRKYKGDRQKLNEELMKLYKEHRVNPLGGCLPLLMQLPVFFALYAVLRGDPRKAVSRFGANALPSVAHLPVGSALAEAIQAGRAKFLGMNLECSPSTAGRGAVELVEGAPPVDCGGSWVAAIPFFVMIALMVFTTWYQQRQMTQMSGQVNPQMQLMGKIMPVFLGFISLSIPAGVLLYWVTTNLWQVGQQHVMLRARERDQDVAPKERPAPKPASKPVSSGGGNGGPTPSKGGGSGPKAGARRETGRQHGGRSRKKRRKR
jgi:YidC/Oxa1 family membrane protein insertase